MFSPVSSESARAKRSVSGSLILSAILGSLVPNIVYSTYVPRKCRLRGDERWFPNRAGGIAPLAKPLSPLSAKPGPNRSPLCEDVSAVLRHNPEGQNCLGTPIHRANTN